MKFTKMQGCGNDYIYINESEEKIPAGGKACLVKRMSDRHYGIGGDGVVFIRACFDADFEMEVYNADGSRAEMCGNGVRCVAKYVYEKGMTRKTKLVIKSCGRKIYTELFTENGAVSSVRVNMGTPLFSADAVPVTGCKYRMQVVQEPIKAAGRLFKMTCVSMGNPHCIVFEDPDTVDLPTVGKMFENNPAFPDRINTEFIKVVGQSELKMRVWERGSGETLACGTGACAAAVAAVLNGYCKKSDKITVHLLGGDLIIDWSGDRVFMTGGAELAFVGETEI